MVFFQLKKHGQLFRATSFRPLLFFINLHPTFRNLYRSFFRTIRTTLIIRQLPEYQTGRMVPCRAPAPIDTSYVSSITRDKVLLECLEIPWQVYGYATTVRCYLAGSLKNKIDSLHDRYQNARTARDSARKLDQKDQKIQQWHR